ncbi:MAG: glycerate kinase, partial [Muribaculaceae bacterium]|nr:glycerate kinase [Muribaculaceae bacterium]
MLSDDERDPKRTSTRGTGDLIADAYAQGCRRFIIGIGGSATNDGGSGMLRALDIRFLDSKGDNLPEGGQALQSLYNIDQSEARRDILDCELTIICDVDNPLTGHDGASRIFGPQKGASEDDVRILDAAL